LIATTVLGLVVPAASADAAQRWASPTSALTSGSCAEVSPCQIDFAISGAASGDEVIVSPGDYSVATPLSPTVPIYLHGVPGRPRPRLVAPVGSSISVLSFKSGGVVRHLGIYANGSLQDALTLQDGIGEDLVLRSAAGDAAKVVVSPGTTVLRDTVAYTAGTDSSLAALKLRDGGKGGGIALRNVTAYGSGGNGIRCETNAGASTLVNVIARGALTDIDASVAGARCAVSHSAFRRLLAPGIQEGAGNTGAAPGFVNAAGGDFHLSNSSPLIDGGTADSLLGALDPDGRPRTLGFAPDIGAYEHSDFFINPDTASPAPPAPVLGSTVTVALVKGKIFVRPRGGRRFRLRRPTSIPVGSLVDSRRGTVALRSALNAQGATQTGKFRGGVFQVRQKRGGNGVTDIILRGRGLGGCRAARAKRALAVASRRRGRRLWSRDRGGRFRTHGRDSIATSRGTAWLTVDRCDGTLTRVSEGAVAVRNVRRRKTVLVRAGHQYLARPRR